VDINNPEFVDAASSSTSPGRLICGLAAYYESYCTWESEVTLTHRAVPCLASPCLAYGGERALGHSHRCLLSRASHSTTRGGTHKEQSTEPFWLWGCFGWVSLLSDVLVRFFLVNVTIGEKIFRGG